jgi:glycerol-3-phosphate dehydrogenase
MHDRETTWRLIEQGTFDVLIIGGGINGACLFDQLVRQGYRTLLVDSNDFGSGTSQASGMMVWGGLLYLRNLDLPTVFRLSCDRDRMIKDLARYVSPRSYRYVPSSQGDINPGLVRAALYFYWCVGLFRRRPPRREESFEEDSILKPGVHRGSLVFEEAVLNSSDCRFTFDWLTPSLSGSSIALNHCSIMGEYSRTDRLWCLNMEDRLRGRETTIRAKLIVNCAGVWTDQVNDRFGIRTPFKHALSKGVYISVKRPVNHNSLMIFEMSDHSDVITFVPWGPVSMWGPTETFPRDIDDGMNVAPEDIGFLLEHIHRHLRRGFDKSEIVSVRCGIRPLAVEKDFRDARYPLDLSRRQRVVPDGHLPWISSYGGKITGCREMANKISRYVAGMVQPGARLEDSQEEGSQASPELISWPGIEEKVPSPAWCARHELCCTLEDYLRRRTNISQWVPRQGLGQKNEHRYMLTDAAMKISGGTREKARAIVSEYEMSVESGFDRVLDRA